MKKQIASTFLMILIVGGIAMSVLNFSTKAYARDAIYGTTPRITSILLQSIAYNNGRHISGEYYCVDEPSTCSIVWAN